MCCLPRAEYHLMTVINCSLIPTGWSSVTAVRSAAAPGERGPLEPPWGCSRGSSCAGQTPQTFTPTPCRVPVESPSTSLPARQAQDPQLLAGKRPPGLGLGCSCAACSRSTARPVLTPKCPKFCPDPNAILLRGETTKPCNK